MMFVQSYNRFAAWGRVCVSVSCMGFRFPAAERRNCMGIPSDGRMQLRRSVGGGAAEGRLSSQGNGDAPEPACLVPTCRFRTTTSRAGIDLRNCRAH